MPEAKITRSIVITVNTVDHNSYGALIFTDKEGTEYKVSDKRAKFFDEIILPDRAVQLNFAVAYEKEYIYNAKPVEGELPPPTKPQVLEEHAKVIEEAVKAVKPEIPGAERGLWWKEMGRCFQSGLFKKDDKEGVGYTLWVRYCTEMLDKLGITIETKGK